MLKSELLEKLKDVAEDADINKTIQSIGLIKPFDIKSLDLNGFKNVLEQNDVAKSYYQSALDSGIGKGVAKYKENFKKNELPKLIEEGIKAKSQEGLTPEQKKIAELEAWKEQAEKEKADMIKLQENTKKLKEKGLDISLAKYIQDEEDITFFSNLINNSVSSGIKEKLHESNYDMPDVNNNGDGKITWQQVIENPSLLSKYNKQNK